ncbi:PREDICTED: zinc-finger homeodomain protein 1-like isoform X3 [Brassica oleracea var. oleracea]|uniref:ZF-HD dimerization-type domain-containing protein n=1 Tax=Brassica oleracea var. oleracea TaxID=109376 RepID=A0A0D2ZQ32_BRAOL|nr:PREDICTED: zinc-finger homeodomain protein 1-like isoform X3 [Brassica oleracea var. oleracea]
MDFEEEINLHEEEEEGDALYDSPPLPPPSRVLKASTESPDTAGTTSTGEGGYMVAHGGSSLGGGGRFRFRECLKNQAVNIGGHAVDGCGEYMPAGIEGTIEALKCAACGCHRNFHRKELPYFHHLAPPTPPGAYRLPAPMSYRPSPSQASPVQLALPPPAEDRMETSSAEAGGMRKRFRTKFTAEQKERMLGLAERIGWRIQRQDDEVIQRFCQETGVPRQVLKVWLHNNKHTRGMSSSSPLDQHQNPTLPPPP